MQSVSSRIWTRVAVSISYDLLIYQREDITALNGGSQKLMNKFIYLKSTLSSIEKEINT